MKFYKTFYLITISVLTFGFKRQTFSANLAPVPLPLLIASEYLYHLTVTSENSKISYVELKPNVINKNNEYYRTSDIKWFTVDTLIASRRFDDADNMRTDLVLLNIQGQVLRQLTHNSNRQFSSCIPSPSHRKLLHFLIKRSAWPNQPTAEDFRRALIAPDQTSSIWNLATNITLPLTGLAHQGLRSFQEQCWSPDETHLAYSVIRSPALHLVNQPINPQDSTIIGGVYIYAIGSQHNVHFLPGGHDASWSPKNYVIAYIKNNGIYLYDVAHDTERLFRPATRSYQPSHVRWLPDGKTIYVQYMKGRRLQEAFYDSISGQELNYAKPGLPGPYFSWCPLPGKIK